MKSHLLFVALCIGLLGNLASAQVTTGTPPLGSFHSPSPGFETIDLSNNNIHFSIPIFARAGRGLPFYYALQYDSSVWQPIPVNGVTTWQPANSTWGWRAASDATTGYVTYAAEYSNYCSAWEYSSFSYYDSFGTAHNLGGSITYPAACGDSTSATFTASDGSGISLYVKATSSGTAGVTTANVYPRGGGAIIPPLQNPNATGNHYVIDRNGNYITISVASSTSTTITDTLGTSATAPLTISGSPTTGNGAVTYTYPTHSGTANVVVQYEPYTVSTHFQAPNVAEYPRTAVMLPYTVTLADTTTYTFTYEKTTGTCTPLSGTYSTNCVTARIGSVTLPSGGTIAYAYTSGYSNNGTWLDGTTAKLTRTNSIDGGSGWVYDRPSSGANSTVTDPQQNQSYLYFSGLYEWQRQIYQGSTSGTLLETVLNCYNGNFGTACTNNQTVNTPITERYTYTELPGATGKWNAHAEFYDNNKGLTKTQDFDFGQGTNGAELQESDILYQTFGTSPTVFYLPNDVQVKDGSANVLSHQAFTYDESSYCCASSGATQLTTPPAGATIRGNVTTATKWTNIASGTTLVAHLSYYDSGTVKQATDVNGGITTNNYASSASTCNFAFPSSVTMPITTLASSGIWDCNGAKPTQATGFNTGENTSYTWDSLWRPTSITDPLGNVLNIYPSQTSVEDAMGWNPGLGGTDQSLVDSILTTDTLGRSHVASHRQGPSAPQLNTYEASETDYDVVGRVSRVTMPYIASSGYGTSSTAPGISTTYDGLGRPLQSTDANGGYALYAYNYNDVLITIGPAPDPTHGDRLKQRQLEYDGMGRLKSVCEIVSGSGTSCGQSYGANGYLTTYSYNTSGAQNFGVVQNANSSPTESRTYNYDALGRLTSETNPESGTTAYVWDFDPSCARYNGDLSKKTDAAGNSTCYAYDSMHRLIITNTFTGPNSSNTPLNYYVYDAATVNSNPMSDAAGRLAEAYTCWAYPCVTKITDEGFEYDLDGHVTDVLQSTPHSGGYYHLTAGYFANGAISAIGGLPQLPAIDYGSFNQGGFYYNLDGEGRPTVIADGSSTTLLSFVTYNVTDSGTPKQPLGAITGITYGTGDTDNFTYDFNTARTQEYTFTVGANNQKQDTALTWNANGSLSKLQVKTDNFNTANVQTCNDLHDDLGRISSVNCNNNPNPWAQTFTYDAFGNITKSGNMNFGCSTCYTTANQYTGFDYDSDGNIVGNIPVLPTITYGWDAAGHFTGINNNGSITNLVYDALGRMVEQQRNNDTNCTPSTDCTEIAYGPNGGKLGLMQVVNSQQTLVKAFVPLPGGATAVYGPPVTNGYAGVMYYRHSDWLGSSRLASTPNRTIYSDSAYAPFGESYAPSGTTDHSFTGQNEDTFTGLDDFPFREYDSATQGRWISPDPAGMKAVDVAEPQSWNRYAYVLGYPLNFTDPLGLCPPGYHSLTQQQRQALIGAAQNWQNWKFGMGYSPAQMKVDCSNFVHQNLVSAHINVPYVRATDIGDKSAQPFYSPISQANLQPGDLIQFNTPGGTHLAIASQTDPANGYNFVGSQTSTGPATVNNWTENSYWNGSRPPSLGAAPAGYFEVCVKDSSGGGGSDSGQQGSFSEWLFSPIYGVKNGFSEGEVINLNSMDAAQLIGFIGWEVFYVGPQRK